jgi:hypothetical protein
MTQLAIIAAYRDHWDDRSLAPVDATDERSIDQRRHASQARIAVRRARSISKHGRQDGAVTPRVEIAITRQEGRAL